jgi:predicted small lipoprotein YifL
MNSLKHFFVALFCAGLLAACGQDVPVEVPDSTEPEPESITTSSRPSHCPQKDQSWTHLFYVVADDGGTAFDTSSVRYLNTMPTLPTNVQMLVLIDRCATPVTSISSTNGPIKESCAQLYRILGDGRLELLDMAPHKLDWLDDSSGDVSMGNPSTLAGFLEFGMSYTDTTNYSLIVAGHGDGDSVGYDSTNDSALNPVELGVALDRALTAMNDECHPKMDLVVMAACAMATAGTYTSLAPHAEYLIASQENIYGYDFHWMGTAGPEGDVGPIHIEDISLALASARVEGEEGMGQQVTWRLNEDDGVALLELVREIGKGLADAGLEHEHLEDESFNQRGYDLRLVTERLSNAELLDSLDSLIERMVMSKTELSTGNRDRIDACGVSSTSSGLSLGGSSLF